MERSAPRERFAVVFRNRGKESAGALEIDSERILLHGRSSRGTVELVIPREDISGVRIGRCRSERLNGYPTLLLERAGEPAVQVAPLGAARLTEIAESLRR